MAALAVSLGLVPVLSLPACFEETRCLGPCLGGEARFAPYHRRLVPGGLGKTVTRTGMKPPTAILESFRSPLFGLFCALAYPYQRPVSLFQRIDFDGARLRYFRGSWSLLFLSAIRHMPSSALDYRKPPVRAPQDAV